MDDTYATMSNGEGAAPTHTSTLRFLMSRNSQAY